MGRLLHQKTMTINFNMEDFMSVNPDFSKWSGNSCSDLSPEDFGVVVATRDDTGDVCVVNHELWRRRMQHYLGSP